MLRPRLFLTDHTQGHFEPACVRGPQVTVGKGLSEALAICCVGALLLCTVGPLLRHTGYASSKKTLTAGKVLRSALPDDTRDEHSPTISFPPAGVTFSLDNIFHVSFSPSLLKHTVFALKPLPGRAPPIV